MSDSIATPHAPGTDRFRYDRVQRTLHWAMAAIIFAAIGIGVYCAYQTPGTSPRRELLDLHKSLGMTAALLLVVRIVYRLLRGEPRYRLPLGHLTHLAARAGHLALYGLMIAMPVSGYVNSGAGGYSLPFFGLFGWPRLVPLDKALSHEASELHRTLAWAIGGVLAVHVLAVFWHAFVLRDEVASRMIRSIRPPAGPEVRRPAGV